MTDVETGRLLDENAYLKARCTQLQGDIVDLEAQITRLSQQLERTYAKRVAALSPNPLSGGQ